MNQSRLKALLFDLRQVLEELEKEIQLPSLLTDEDFERINASLKQSPFHGPVNPPYPNKLGNFPVHTVHWTPNKDRDVN